MKKKFRQSIFGPSNSSDSSFLGGRVPDRAHHRRGGVRPASANKNTQRGRRTEEGRRARVQTVHGESGARDRRGLPCARLLQVRILRPRLRDRQEGQGRENLAVRIRHLLEARGRGSSIRPIQGRLHWEWPGQASWCPSYTGTSKNLTQAQLQERREARRRESRAAVPR